jgi:hypothetical protein
VAEVPDSSNFFSSLHTTLSRKQVAWLYGALGWRVRKCWWVDYEVISDWAELVIEAESPILMHGPVADLPARQGGRRGSALVHGGGFLGHRCQLQPMPQVPGVCR